MKYSITLQWSDEDEGYIALCPEFPLLSAFGETPDDAVKEIQVAIAGALETYRSEGWDVPQPRKLAKQK